MYEHKKMERYLRVNLLGPGPRLVKKESTGPRSHKGWETLLYGIIQSVDITVWVTDSLFQWTASVEWEFNISEEIVNQLYQTNVVV